MKITDEELDSCPVCDIKLGCSPLEKLRYLIMSFSYKLFSLCHSNFV
jgi:hypothetical protein